MNAPAKPGALRPLVERLRQCPSPDLRCSEQQLNGTWSEFKQIALDQGDAVTPAVLLGVILHDPETFAPLLNAAEQAQLQALGKVALERYLHHTNPPNKLGKTLAAAVKEKL